MSSPAYLERHSTLKCELERTPTGTVLWVTLNRPAAFNALSGEMLAELHAVFSSLEHPPTMLTALPEDQPRVVVLRAAGRAFCGGVDIKAAEAGVGGKAWDYKDMRSQQLLSRLVEKMRQVPQPVIAAVQGAAAGGGFALALASDVRVASRDARFSAAFVRLGLTGTDMGTSYFLWRTAGLGIASELLMTGRQLGAERAYQLGLVNELVESPGELEAAARKLAGEMLACSRVGLQESSPASCRLGGCCPLALLSSRDWRFEAHPASHAACFLPLLASLLFCLYAQLTKEQLSAVADGGSLRAALTAENSHQMLLVNDPTASAAAMAWLRQLMGGKKGGGSDSGGGGSGGGSVSNGAGGGTPRSKL